MFKRYKGGYETEGTTSTQTLHHEETPTRKPFAPPVAEVPPRIFEPRTPASPTPPNRIRVQEEEVRVEEETLFSDEMLSESAPSPVMSTEEPETTVGKNVSIKGELKFDRLLRIDGSFDGELISNGKIIVGPTGVVKADIALEEAVVEGRVIGDILVERIELRCQAEVRGNITAKTISVDEGVTIIGQVSVTPSIDRDD